MQAVSAAWLSAHYQRVKKLPNLKSELAKLGARAQTRQSTKTHRVMLEMIGAQFGIKLVKKKQASKPGKASTDG